MAPPTHQVEYHFNIGVGLNQGKIRIFFLKIVTLKDFLILVLLGNSKTAEKS